MDNKPQIPSLGQTQKEKDKKKLPLLRLRGLSNGGQTLLERLKQFKKKDLAFILAGLGVLFMAPLAEHFMMAPESPTGQLGEGFSSQGEGSFGFGKGGSPYEGGLNGLAPGGLAGGNNDLITPLNVRDPAALVLGPGAAEQPPAASSSAAPPPAPPSDNGAGKWNEAVGEAAQSAGSHASLPVPKIPLSSGSLPGLGAVEGAHSGASYSLPPISAANVPNRAAPSNSLTGTNGSGFKGVARGPGTGATGAGNLEGLRARAGQAFDGHNAAVNTPLAATEPGLKGGGNGGGAGQGSSAADKGGAGSSIHGNKSPGESLEFLAAKANQQHAIDLAWKLKEKDALLWPNLREKLLDEMVMTPAKMLAKSAGKAFDGFGASAASGVSWDCTKATPPGGPVIAIEDLDKCDFTKQSAAACIVNQSGNTATIYANNSNYVGCTLTTSGSTAATPSQTVPGVANIGPAAPGAQSKGGAATAESTLVSVCTTIQQQLDALQSQGGGSNASAGISAVRTQKQKILNESAVAAANIMAAAGALSEGKQTSYSCAGQSAAAVLSDGNNILNMLDATKNQLIGKEPSGIYPTLGASLKATQDSVGVFLTGDKLKIQDGKISEAIQKYQVALSVTRIDSTRLQAAKAAVQKELDVLIKGPGLLADPNLGRNLNIAQVVPTKDVVNAATVNLKASNKALEGTEALLGTAKTNSQNADIGAKALSSDSEQKQYLGVTSQIQAQYDKTNALYGAAMKDWTAQSGALNAAAGEIGSPGLISQASKAAQDAKSYTTEKTPTSPVVSVQSMYTTAAQELSKNPPCPTFAANSKSVEEGLSKTQGTGARVIAAANEQRKKVSDATTALSGLQ